VSASPQLLTGLRISPAISLMLAVLGEMIVSNHGSDISRCRRSAPSAFSKFMRAFSRSPC
jgi:hypothetical protein